MLAAIRRLVDSQSCDIFFPTVAGSLSLMATYLFAYFRSVAFSHLTISMILKAKLLWTGLRHRPQDLNRGIQHASNVQDMTVTCEGLKFERLNV